MAPMPKLPDLLKAKGLERIADVVQTSVKRSIRLTTGARTKDACNRLGGAPNLAPELEWPQWRGHSLAFLAQFDLNALPVIDGFDLPHEGSLFFFHEGGEDASWACAEEDPGYARVLFSKQSLTECAPRAFPDDLEDERRYRGLELSNTPVEETIPDSCDQVIEELGLTHEESDHYEEVWEQWNSRRPDFCHRLAGYPDRLQGDLRLQAQLAAHGLIGGEAYEEGRRKGLWAGAKDWELLLQIDSDEDARMMWGDCGRIYYLIHKDDLRERRFERVWVGLECM